MTQNDLIRRYFPEDKIPDVLEILALYGVESWHREQERGKRDAIIISRGSLEKLKTTILLAMTDYRDILIGEEVDPWVISELKQLKNIQP
jgi:hypothetical protein